MGAAPRFPWLLGATAIAVFVAAVRGAGVDAPEPATTAALSWRGIHGRPEVARGPNGLGAHFSGIASNGARIITAAPAFAFTSDDDGASWQDNPLRTAMRLAVVDSLTIIAGTQRSGLRRSTDGGTTWKNPLAGLDRSIPGLAVAGRSVFAFGSDTAFVSHDAGETWTTLPVRSLQYDGAAARGRTVIAVGGSGYVARSTDLGEHFSEQWLAEEFLPGGVAFADDTTAVIVGSRGHLFRSVDAGATWSRVSVPTDEMLTGVAFADSLHGLAVGGWGEALRTTDAGRTWTREFTGTTAHLRGVAVHPAGGFIAAGHRETVLRAMSR